MHFVTTLDAVRYHGEAGGCKWIASGDSEFAFSTRYAESIWIKWCWYGKQRNGKKNVNKSKINCFAWIEWINVVIVPRSLSFVFDRPAIAVKKKKATATTTTTANEAVTKREQIARIHKKKQLNCIILCLYCVLEARRLPTSCFN